MMDDILHQHIDAIPVRHKRGHAGYEYRRRDLVPFKQAGFAAALYEIPPGKAAYPYHYHVKNEELFYILSGCGTLRTPQGERAVQAGDVLYFPANERGAHKLSNTGTETLAYLDFGTLHDLDAAFYPDSNKIGVWGMGINKVYLADDNVGYYEGE